LSININFGQKASICDETIYILGRPGKTWKNLGFGSIQVKLNLGNGKKI